MALTKQQLLALNNSSFPNNNAGFITPELLRTYNSSSIGAFVDEIDYTIDSASVDLRLDNLENFSSSLVTNFATVAYVNGVSASLTSTASFNAYTQSTNNTINGLATTSSVNALTASINSVSSSVGLLQTFSGSQYKADSASFSNRIVAAENTGYVTTSSFNAYTQSTNLFTASISTSVGSLQTFSGSQYKADSASFSIRIEEIDDDNVTTASFNAYTTSTDSRLNSIEAKTGSFATTGSNIFNGNQTINGNVSASSFVSASKFIGDGSQLTGVTASVSIAILDEGVYKGNATALNFTGSGLTASVIAGIATIQAEVDLETLNQYTLTSSFNTFTSSYNTFSGSQYKADSSSFDSRLDAIDISVYVSTASFNAYTSSQDFKNTTFATTGSNVFIGNQTISGSLFISGSEVVAGPVTASKLQINGITDLNGTLDVSNDATFRGDVLIQSATPNLKLRDTSGGGFSSGYDLRVDTGSFEIYDDTHDRDVLSDFFNSASQQHTTSLTSEIIVISGSTSVTLLGNVSASIISASTINGLGNPLTFSTSVDSRLDAFEAVSSSYARTNVNNTFGGTQNFLNIAVAGTASIGYLESVTGSAKIIGDAFIILNNDTPAQRYAGIIVVDSGSTAATASFQFDGETNDWFYEYTSSTDNDNFGVALFGPEYNTKGSPVYNTINTIVKGNGGHHLIDSQITDDGTTVRVVNAISASTFTGLGNLTLYSASVDSRLDNLELGSSSVSTSVGLLQTFSSSQYKADSSSFDSRIDSIETAGYVTSTTFNAYTQSTNDFTASITASYNATSSSLNSVSSSLLEVSGAYVETSQSLNAVSGNVYTNTISISTLSSLTSSYATTGSNSLTGSQIITGSLTITGSVATPPVALSIASNTASIDFSKGSIYTLTLVSGSNTYITASNLTPGQTANLVVTQASALSGSIVWASAFKFPTGSAYTGSKVANAVDLISFITVNNSTIYSVGAQNLV
jgi:deoxycytidine triphosphate deaminase